MYCDNCGAKVSPGLPFCPYCGYGLGGRKANPARGGHRRTILIWLARFALLVIFLLLAFLGSTSWPWPSSNWSCAWCRITGMPGTG